MENLNINNMINGEVSNSNLYNVSIKKLSNILSNKIFTAEKVIHKVESYYTSKDCNYRNDNLKKEDRSWLCTTCHTL